jgi:hypothetical protein
MRFLSFATSPPENLAGIMQPPRRCHSAEHLTYSVDGLEDAVYQFLPFAIVETSQGHPATQMRVIIDIASGTTQVALARNLSRK